MTQKTHLLIDGDIIAFIAAARSQHTLEDEESGWLLPIANKKEGEAAVENILYGLKVGLKADSFEVILSDHLDNWRYGVDPTYKTNRTGPRPQLLAYLKDYLRVEHDAYSWAGLEADDVLGVLMTMPGHCAQCKAKGGEGRGLACLECPVRDARLICVGRDKDFKSIPGLHHSIRQDVDINTGSMLVREVTQWEADRFHLIQCLAGDRVDGFDGCPGIGMTRAADIIDNPVLLVPKEGVKTRGVNKGEAVTKWMAEPTLDYWACIVSHYRKAGKTEDDALKTARMARILRYPEYDPETEVLTLWTPDMLRGVGR